MRIEVRGVPLGVALFQCEEERQTGQNKWTDEQQRERTRQLRYGCGKRREFHYPSIKDLINSPRNHPLLNPGASFRDISFRSCGAHGLRYPFRIRHDGGRVSTPAPRRAIMTYSRCRGVHDEL